MAKMTAVFVDDGDGGVPSFTNTQNIMERFSGSWVSRNTPKSTPSTDPGSLRLPWRQKYFDGNEHQQRFQDLRSSHMFR